MMQGNCQVTFTFIQEALQTLPQSHRRHRDTLRTPSESPLLGQDLCGAEYGLVVVKRFALSHKHDIRQSLALGQSIYLIQDFAGTQGTIKSLAACHTESTAHLASHLRRYAQGRSIAIGDIDGFHEVPIQRTIQIFDRAIHRMHSMHRSVMTDTVFFRESLTRHLRQIRHTVDVCHALAVQPVSHLLRHELRQRQFLCHILQLGRRHPQQGYFVVNRFLHFVTNLQEKNQITIGLVQISISFSQKITHCSINNLYIYIDVYE